MRKRRQRQGVASGGGIADSKAAEEGSRGTSLFPKGESATPLSLGKVKRRGGWSQCVDDLRIPVQEEFGLVVATGNSGTRRDLPCASERSSGNLQEGLVEWYRESV